MQEIIQAIDFDIVIKVIMVAVVIPVIKVIKENVTQFISIKIDETKTKIKESNLNIDHKTTDKILERVKEIMLECVTCTSETFVAKIKGTEKWNEEAMRLAFEKTKDAFQRIITQEMLQVIMSICDDYNKWLEVNIENMVVESKKINKKNVGLDKEE